MTFGCDFLGFQMHGLIVTLVSWNIKWRTEASLSLCATKDFAAKAVFKYKKKFPNSFIMH